ncbi:hypothetical protein OUZ56_023799 [Daphnia magna]|uniref:Uncharacterized protein n=1 Tax=Daphnia magna TaxID=35525 RepID=A0ABR0AZM7_9CRUS|nr:hypothetical protein OUZ56_023799 [Daphnia magna]
MIFTKKQKDYMLNIISRFSDPGVRKLFNSRDIKLPSLAIRPKPGFQCMIQWEGEKFAQDWRMNEYNWRQQRGKVDYALDKKYFYEEGSQEFEQADREKVQVHFSRLTFKLRINCGELVESCSTEFPKKAYMHSNLSVVSPTYSLGNAKREEKTQKPLFRTAKSVLELAKEREGDQPAEVYLDMIKIVGDNMKKQAV